jgi:hypothetical protein
VSVRVVLDSSAVVAYGRGSLAVGELIAIVAEEQGTVAVPITCLAEAYGAVKGVEAAVLEYLAVGLAAVTVLPLELHDAAAVGIMSRQASLGVAHAVAASARGNAYLATVDGALVRRLVDDDRLIIDL